MAFGAEPLKKNRFWSRAGQTSPNFDQFRSSTWGEAPGEKSELVEMWTLLTGSAPNSVLFDDQFVFQDLTFFFDFYLTFSYKSQCDLLTYFLTFRIFGFLGPVEDIFFLDPTTVPPASAALASLLSSTRNEQALSLQVPVVAHVWQVQTNTDQAHFLMANVLSCTKS